MNQTSHLADQAAQSAENAIRSTQRVANEAEHLAERGMAVLRDRSQQMRDKAMHTSDSTVAYIKDEPFKAVLIAAAGGAALMALAALLSRSHSRH